MDSEWIGSIKITFTKRFLVKKVSIAAKYVSLRMMIKVQDMSERNAKMKLLVCRITVKKLKCHASLNSSSQTKRYVQEN